MQRYVRLENIDWSIINFYSFIYICVYIHFIFFICVFVNVSFLGSFDRYNFTWISPLAFGSKNCPLNCRGRCITFSERMRERMKESKCKFQFISTWNFFLMIIFGMQILRIWRFNTEICYKIGIISWALREVILHDFQFWD